MSTTYDDRVSLRYVILTGLNERPATGFDLARRFDKSIGYFWSASHQQIYRNMDQLSTDGWIKEVEDGGKERRGQPRHFVITDAGRAALIDWVGQVDEPAPLKETLLVRIRAAATLGAPHLPRDAVQRHLDAHRALLETYEEIERRDFTPDTDRHVDAASADADDVTSKLQHLILRRGIEMEASWVGWCEELLEVVEAAADANPERSVRQ